MYLSYNRMINVVQVNGSRKIYMTLEESILLNWK